jgi:dihydrofolate reductase
MKVRAIVVAFGAENRVIGDHGAIPWAGQVPADMEFLYEKIRGASVILGSATFLTVAKFYKKWPTAQVIVLSRDAEKLAQLQRDFPDISVASSLDDALEKSTSDETLILGGAKVYAESLARAAELGINTIFATEIHGEFAGDALFPVIDDKTWQKTAEEKHQKDAINHFDYDFITYERRKND